MKTYARYAEQYNKRKNPQQDKSRLITSENETYQQFIEIQLEKVTNALLMTKDYEERLMQLEKSNVNHEEKMSKFMNMVKLLQNFAEAQEKENIRLSDKITEFNRIDNFSMKFEPRIKNLESDFMRLTGKIDGEFNEELRFLKKSLQDFKNMNNRKGIDECMDRFREEVNKKIEMVMLETQKSALNSDLEQMQKVLDEEKIEREVLFEQINKDSVHREKMSNELLDEILKKYRNLEETLNIRMEGKNCVEEHFDCSLKIGKLEKEIDDLKYSTHVIQTKISKNAQSATIKDLQSLEKSLTQQFSKGLDQFGELIKKYVNNQNNLVNRMDSLEKIRNYSNKSKIDKENEVKLIENPFIQNKENLSLYSNHNKSFEKRTNFQEYLKNSREIRANENKLDSSSDLEELLINKEKKNLKKKPRSIEKMKKKRSRSASNFKKNEKTKIVVKENNSKSVKKQRKKSPDSKSILNRISMERKEKENRIKEMMKKERKLKNIIKIK